ncbi:hypothetical protein ACP70R_044325 [Stipagrostis hirtigluma subsp. patula]
MTKNISAFAVLFLVAMLALQQLAVEADVECSDVLTGLSPCLDFVQGDEAQPSAACCAGVTNLVEAAETTADRQATCECLKSAMGQVSGDLSGVQALPGDCGLKLSYTISPDMDCSTDRMKRPYQIP